MAKNLIRSRLADTAELKRKLNKIKGQHVVVEIGSARMNSRDCSNFLIDETATNDPIQFNRPGDVLVAVKASATFQGCTFQADTAGAAGNSITVALTTGATAGSEVVTVVGNAISVQIQSGVTTRTQLKAALDGNVGAAAKIDTSVTAGATAVTAPVTATALSGGLDADALERYELSDIKSIRRLRTKKWLIILNQNADPATSA